MNARFWFSLAILALLFGVCLFGGAGTLDWPAGWAFILVFFTCAIAVTGLVARDDPALLAERMKGTNQPGQPLWDKIFLMVMQIVWFGWLAVMGADAVRLHWSVMPVLLRVAGGALLILSYWMMHRVFRENTFLAPVVRVQSERGHRVISTGPYSIVRHPLYAAALLVLAGTPLMLGSWYGLLTGSALAASFAYRAVKEERVLRRSLEGYEAYATRVRYRMVPGLW